MPAAFGSVPSMADADRSEWLQKNLPVVAGVVGDFADVFGRENIKVVYAKEGGHELGKRGPDGISLVDVHVGPLALKGNGK